MKRRKWSFIWSYLVCLNTKSPILKTLWKIKARVEMNMQVCICVYILLNYFLIEHMGPFSVRIPLKFRVQKINPIFVEKRHSLLYCTVWFIFHISALKICVMNNIVIFLGGISWQRLFSQYQRNSVGLIVFHSSLFILYYKKTDCTIVHKTARTLVLLCFTWCNFFLFWIPIHTID